MAGHIRAMKAQLYIERENGDLVPLVAVDELPDAIHIHDVPPKLSTKSVKDMYCVGSLPHRNDKHSVTYTEGLTIGSSLKNPFRRSVVIPKSRGKMETVKIQPVCDCLPTDLSHNPSGPSQSTHASQSKDDLANSKPSIALTSPKRYCSYWLRKGECDYAQQGCLYKHEMPLDLVTLNQLGFRDIPTWYRNQYGAGSLLAARGSGAALGPSNAKSMVASQTRRETPARGKGRSQANKRRHPKEIGSVHHKERPSHIPAAQEERLQPRTALMRNQKARAADLVNKQDSPLYGQPKLRCNETLADRQYLEALKVVHAYEESQPPTKVQNGNLLHQLERSVPASHTKSAKDKSRDSPSTTITSFGTELQPQVQVPHAIITEACKSSRNGSLASHVTDIELEMILAEQARRAKEDAAYQICVARHKAEQQRNARYTSIRDTNAEHST